jgi:hypothetical protein
MHRSKFWIQVGGFRSPWYKVGNDCQGPISEQEVIKKQRNIGEAMANIMDFLELSPPDLWRLPTANVGMICFAN